MRKYHLTFTHAIVWLFLSRPTYAAEGALKLCHLEGVVQSLIRIALGAGGLALFLMIVLGGFKWLIAGVNDKAVAEAKGTITWAIIGIVLMIASFFVLEFIKAFTGIDVTLFSIPWVGNSARPSDCP